MCPAPLMWSGLALASPWGEMVDPSLSPMRQALSLARMALGRVSPNPAVGAVVVKDGRVVGTGFTHPPGGPHAEVVALAEAAQAASGATLYVSMEPCVHHGRTPPCTEAIIAVGLAEVHLAALDPNPKVNGAGKAALEGAGIAVTVGEEAQEAQQVIEAFAKHVVTRLPFVTAKFAMSLDGKIATGTGDSQWITGDEALHEAHRLRAEHDAVMVGIGTALADNPRLTARDLQQPLPRQPLRVVVDSGGRLSASSAMLQEPGDTLVAVAGAPVGHREALTASGAEVVQLPGPDGRVDLPGLLKLLGERDVTSLLVEGGGELLGALFDLGLVDKVVAFVAPVVIGGAQAPSPVGGGGVPRLAEALRLRDVAYQVVGQDMMVSGYPLRGREALG